MNPVSSRRGPALALAAALVLAACQPVDDYGVRDRETPPSAAASPLGSPVQGMPADLVELLARTTAVAREWQDEPRVAEVRVGLGARDRWASAEVTYLAPSADRILTVTVDADGVGRELSTLATLNLRPVSARGLALLPELPPEVWEPAALARSARSALRRCGLTSPVDGVLYATGAPVSWNGRRWTAPPVWTATVTTDRGGVQVDPLTGDDLRCVTRRSR
jgi:hypothetical protein